MFALFDELLSYSFLVRALIVGSLVALCAALLGVSLVLKRYSMIGDGLSHVGFGAACVAMALNVAPLKISVPVVIIAAFLLMRINDNAKIKGDAAVVRGRFGTAGTQDVLIKKGENFSRIHQTPPSYKL